MSNHPRWVYPDAPATTRGVLVHSDVEEDAHRAKCAQEDAAQGHIINGDASRTVQDVIESREYADGTTATGPGPLPGASPAEQEAAAKPAKAKPAKAKPARKGKGK